MLSIASERSFEKIRECVRSRAREPDQNWQWSSGCLFGAKKCSPADVYDSHDGKVHVVVQQKIMQTELRIRSSQELTSKQIDLMRECARDG